MWPSALNAHPPRSSSGFILMWIQGTVLSRTCSIVLWCKTVSWPFVTHYQKTFSSKRMCVGYEQPIKRLRKLGGKKPLYLCWAVFPVGQANHLFFSSFNPVYLQYHLCTAFLVSLFSCQSLSYSLHHCLSEYLWYSDWLKGTLRSSSEKNQ